MQPIDTSAILSAQNLRCRRSGREILRGVNLTVRAGEHLGIVGINGSGKSSLLRLAAGLLHPRAGTLLICGRPPTRPQTRQNVGWLPDRTVYPNLSVSQIFELGRRTTRSTATDVHRVCQQLELNPLLSTRAVALSQGQGRRLALALALLHRPKLLLLDEPFTALDAPSARLARTAIDEATAAGATVVAAAPSAAGIPDFIARTRVLTDGLLENR